MLRSGGTMLILFAVSHDTSKILELMAEDAHFAPYMEVNIIIYNIWIYNFLATNY
jgi:hypothetical protein